MTARPKYITEGRARKLDLLVSHERLTALLQYDRHSGRFFWLQKPAKNIVVGTEAGHVYSTGYCLISIAGVLYYRHRLAWFYETGEWPPDEIDHRQGVEASDKIANLRPATKQQNSWNSRVHKRNKLGIKGVRLHDGAYEARISVKGKNISLGRFPCAQEAAAAYRKATRKYFGEFASSRGAKK